MEGSPLGYRLPSSAASEAFNYTSISNRNRGSSRLMKSQWVTCQNAKATEAARKRQIRSIRLFSDTGCLSPVPFSLRLVASPMKPYPPSRARTANDRRVCYLTKAGRRCQAVHGVENIQDWKLCGCKKKCVRLSSGILRSARKAESEYL